MLPHLCSCSQCLLGCLLLGKLQPCVRVRVRVSQTQNCSSMIPTLTLCYGGDQMLQVLGCQATPEHGPHPSARQLLLSYGPTATSLVRREGGGGLGGRGVSVGPLARAVEAAGTSRVCLLQVSIYSVSHVSVLLLSGPKVQQSWGGNAVTVVHWL